MTADSPVGVDGATAASIPERLISGPSDESRLTGKVLFLLAGLAALAALATNIILPAFPRIGDGLGVSAQELGLTLSSFFIAFAFGQLLAGPLSDRFGRRWLVLAGLAIFSAGSILCAFAGTLPLLILGRVIQALGASAASVLSRAIARDLFEGRALARALALTMIAGAAAPGFSPLIGSALDSLFGWRVTFLVVAAFGVGLALHYSTSVGETHPADRRPSLKVSAASAYARLAVNARFLLPAASVSLILGGLYSFFAAAPAIMMGELNFTSLQLGLYFAVTVLIVFAAGFLAPRLAHRWGQQVIGLLGILIALAGSIFLFAFASALTLIPFTIALSLYLFGMGLISPLGTSIALTPFGTQAGLASALLGFMQMGCAAIGASLASVLPLQPSASLAVILTTGSALALLVFLPVPMRQPRAEVQA
jgi:MFS transporter, DHA1 family, multidrug resistance protein